ncbi:hypothetical protein WN944_006693 [Citrus x changshan-huyou]|uniref:Uncharacterized protein n=1 Tax=Citrus x changshan-huyou TaxID=2935761 RepID=A0AAP0QU27_9ROSI
MYARRACFLSSCVLLLNNKNKRREKDGPLCHLRYLPLLSFYTNVCIGYLEIFICALSRHSCYLRESCKRLFHITTRVVASNGIINFVLIIRGVCDYNTKFRNAQPVSYQAAIVYDDGVNGQMNSLLATSGGAATFSVGSIIHYLCMYGGSYSRNQSIQFCDDARAESTATKKKSSERMA